MTYSTMLDLQNRLPFTLNTNSKPTASQASGILDQAYDAINGYCFIDPAVDTFDNDTGLKAVERDLAVNYCLDWHYGERPFMEFTDDHKETLIPYKKIFGKTNDII